MLFKTYQKLLGASCLALYLVGCGGGGGGESPVEIEKNDFNSTLKIISKADNVEIQDLKLNRGNCKHNRNLLKELMQRTANARRSVAEKEKEIKNHQAEIAGLQKNLEELTQWVQQFNSLDKLLETTHDLGMAAMYSSFADSVDKLPRKFKLLYRTIDTDKHQAFIDVLELGASLSDNYNTEDNNRIYVVKRILDNYNYKYEPNKEPPNRLWDVPDTLHTNIKGSIKDTKNPKDYLYINLKELKKLIDSIVDDKGNLVHGFFTEVEKKDYWDYHIYVSEKGLQSLAKLKSMLPSVEKFYFAYLKEAIPRHAKEDTEKLISLEEESIQAIQAELTETTQDISKMEKIIKDLESKKNTMAVDLKFGESFTTQYRCQNLIEIGVKTDKGSWTFNFDR
ncbi:hypothetical protein ACLGDE_07745 [Helicobacter pylori]